MIDITEYDRYAKYMANKFAKTEEDFEDYYQSGLERGLRFISSNKIPDKAELKKEIIRGIDLASYHKNKNKTREYNDEFIELHTENQDIESRVNLEIERRSEILIGGLKSKYGGWYLVNHKKENKRFITNIVKLVKMLVENVEEIPLEEVPRKLNKKFINKYQLDHVFLTYFDRSLEKFVNSLYPNTFQPWELNKLPANYFKSKENRTIALNWLMEKYDFKNFENITSEEMFRRGSKSKINKKIFVQKKLGQLSNYYNNNIYNLFQDLTSKKIYPWILDTKSGWEDTIDSKIIQPFRWLIEDYCKISVDDIPLYVDKEFIEKSGIGSIIQRKVNGKKYKVYQVVHLSYPGKFTNEDFKRNRKKIKIHPNQLYDNWSGFKE